MKILQKGVLIGALLLSHASQANYGYYKALEPIEEKFSCAAYFNYKADEPQYHPNMQKAIDDAVNAAMQLPPSNTKIVLTDKQKAEYAQYKRVASELSQTAFVELETLLGQRSESDLQHDYTNHPFLKTQTKEFLIGWKMAYIYQTSYNNKFADISMSYETEPEYIKTLNLKMCKNYLS